MNRNISNQTVRLRAGGLVLHFFRQLALLLLLVMAAAASAQQQVAIGYCADEVAPQTRPVGIDQGGDTRISAAIRLPRTTMMRYQGMTVTRLRFAVREGFQGVSVWIRSRLDASSLVVQSVSTLHNGWNDVALTRPLPIDGSELYIGYTATQPEGFEGILASGQGNELTSWLAVDNQWADYHDYGLGILYIQAVAEGTLLQRETTVIGLSTDRLAYTPAETLTVSGEVENLGHSDIAAFTLGYLVDGRQVATETVSQTLRPDEVAAFSRQLPLDGLAEGAHSLEVTVDGQAATATGPQTFYIYESTWPRTLLLEHFTSLNCVNCPPVDRLIEQVVAGRTDVAWVTHRVGYRDDEFTIEDSRQLTRFGVGGNPFIMLDRTAFNEGEPPAFTVGGYSAAQVASIFDYAASMPAFVTLQAEARADDGRLTVRVGGQSKAFVQQLYPRATLHLFLVEDQVPSVGVQAGDANKRIHDNVLRAFVTPPRGVLPVWQPDGTAFSWQSDEPLALDPAWQTARLRVVAFLVAQAPAGSGYPTGQVLNTVQTPVADASGLSPVTNGPGQSGPWFMPDGRRVASPERPGLYIRNHQKIMIK